MYDLKSLDKRFEDKTDVMLSLISLLNSRSLYKIYEDKSFCFCYVTSEFVNLPYTEFEEEFEQKVLKHNQLNVGLYTYDGFFHSSIKSDKLIKLNIKEELYQYLKARLNGQNGSWYFKGSNANNYIYNYLRVYKLREDYSAHSIFNANRLIREILADNVINKVK